jgi:DNA topoisomerase IB
VRLRRSDPGGPGLTRRRRGRGFSYHLPDGTAVTDEETLERVASLAIPPAWTDVWICPWPHGHLQALGTDEAGRRQYLYHPVWRVRRDTEKFARSEEFGARLPRLRESLGARLGTAGLTEERVLAAAVRLLDLGLFRVGSEQYTKDNGSFGLATALRDHVSVRRGVVGISFTGKGGGEFRQEIRDPAVGAVVRSLIRRNDPGERLLAWWSPSQRAWREVRSEHVNEYLRSVSGLDVTAKDFRTWHASVLMGMELGELELPTTATARKRAVVGAYRAVAEQLQNTPAVCRSSYVDPRVVDLWQAGRRLPARVAGDSELVPTPASVALCRALRSEPLSSAA